MSGVGPLPVRSAYCVFGVRSEYIRVLAYHLRLKPKTEFHTQRVDVLDDFGEPALELIGVDEPVAESRPIVVANAEPAVVKNECVNARTANAVRYRLQLFGSEVE